MASARPALRKLLDEVLRSDSDLEAFCSDYFSVQRSRFTLGMERSQKLTILLDYVDEAAIVDALRQAYPEAAPKIDEVLSVTEASHARDILDDSRIAAPFASTSAKGIEPPRRAATRTVALVALPMLAALALGGALWRWTLGRAVVAPQPGQLAGERAPSDSALSVGGIHANAPHASPAAAASRVAPPEPTAAREIECTGDALADPMCSYRGTLRDTNGAPLPRVHVELVGTRCVKTTDATGNFEFLG